MNSMEYEILSHSKRSIEPKELKELYNSVDWWPERSVEEIAKILDDKCYAAWQDGKMVGFVRYISDGHFRAYVEDAVVLPEYQNKGVGQKLMQESLKDFEDIDVISLFCEEKLIPFYERSGFEKAKKQLVMHKKIVEANF